MGRRKTKSRIASLVPPSPMPSTPFQQQKASFSAVKAWGHPRLGISPGNLSAQLLNLQRNEDRQSIGISIGEKYVLPKFNADGSPVPRGYIVGHSVPLSGSLTSRTKTGTKRRRKSKSPTHSSKRHKGGRNTRRCKN